MFFQVYDLFTVKQMYPLCNVETVFSRKSSGVFFNAALYLVSSIIFLLMFQKSQLAMFSWHDQCLHCRYFVPHVNAEVTEQVTEVNMRKIIIDRIWLQYKSTLVE